MGRHAHIGLIFTPVISRTVRAAVLAETELDYVQAARLRGERSSVHHVLRDPPERHVRSWSSSSRCGSGMRSSPSRRSTFIGFGVPPPSPDWAAQINQYWTLIDPYWWMTLFPALAIASLVVAVNLVADGIREVYER